MDTFTAFSNMCGMWCVIIIIVIFVVVTAILILRKQKGESVGMGILRPKSLKHSLIGLLLFVIGAGVSIIGAYLSIGNENLCVILVVAGVIIMFVVAFWFLSWKG